LTASAVPPGYELLDSISPFHALVGPLYKKNEPDAFHVGMVVAHKHLNTHGIVHGGMICTLVDSRWLRRAPVTDPPRRLVRPTSRSLCRQRARWRRIEARVDVMRPGRQVAFVNCFVYYAGERIARGSGTFLVLRRGG
jgi:acyl-coenzyme A thioesterase PaaI-like protein